jgi:hypothetical protein
MQWGGAAVDPGRQLVVAPTNRLPFLIRLVPGNAVDSVRRHEGGEVSRQRGTPFGMRRTVLTSSDRIPCSKPPWGALTAVNAATGAVAWEVPLGYLPSLAAKDSAALRWGSINLGGPIVTAGGLVFIAATADAHLRALDIESGRELWSAALPTGGAATPMTYSAGGRQFVVVAAGGHDRLPFGPLGDYLVAFALPSSPPAITGDSSVSATGTWTGDLRIERERLATALDLRPGEGGLVGTLRGLLEGDTGQVIAGPVHATLEGTRFRFTASFGFTAKDCTGTISGEGQLVNRGGLLTGKLHLESSCGEHIEEGTFGLRRGEVH